MRKHDPLMKKAVVLALFDKGQDTAQMSKAFQVREASVANLLARALEERRAKTGNHTASPAVYESSVENRKGRRGLSVA
jgi:hypothetical protein